VHLQWPTTCCAAISACFVPRADYRIATNNNLLDQPIGADEQHLIEDQSRSILIVAHACEFIPRINLPRPAEEELLERLPTAEHLKMGFHLHSSGVCHIV